MAGKKKTQTEGEGGTEIVVEEVGPAPPKVTNMSPPKKPRKAAAKKAKGGGGVPGAKDRAAAERVELLNLYTVNPSLMKVESIPSAEFVNGLSEEEVRARLQAAKALNDSGIDSVVAQEALSMVGGLGELLAPRYLDGLEEELTKDDNFSDAARMYLTGRYLSRMPAGSKWGLVTVSKMGRVVRRNMRRNARELAEQRQRAAQGPNPMV